MAVAPIDAAPVATTPLLASNKQLVTAVVDDWDATTATMRLYYRNKEGGWSSEGDPWPAVIGANGSGWGAGLHGVGAPAGRTGPVKHEGDKKNPAGAFVLRGGFGYAQKAPPTRLAYQSMSDAWKCVDDPSSQKYNTLLDESTVTKDWSSAEEMHRKDVLYTWGIEVAHNAQRTPGNGSCIFLHVWSGPGTHTVGCTAMPEDKLLALFASLDPANQPVFVLLPRAEYAALGEAWDLPPLVP
jgi:L,D-peptidoglycan transpeptidase YkuD (ErfK/YbiS/YcfS/YnhG family)